MTLRWNDTALNLAAHPVGWPLARLARRLGGVVRVPGLGVVISDAEVAHDVLTRDDLFTKNGPRSFSAGMTELFGESALGNMDGQPHRRLRATLSDIVTPARANELLAVCEPVLADLRRDLGAGRTVDLVAFMRLISGRITFDMLGAGSEVVSDDACLALVALGERITSGVGLGRLAGARLARTRRDANQLGDEIRRRYDSVSAPPMSFIARLKAAGLTSEEARGVLSILFLAGTLTTAAALPRLVALLVDGGHLPALRASPDGATAAIAEGLRYTTPVPATVRIAQGDGVVRGHRFQAGDRLLILTCNLARDPAMFPEPDRFDPARVMDPRARFLWYGAGPHFCLGFAVAQRQLALVLRALLDLPGALQVVRRRAARRVIVPAYAELHVRMTAA